MNKSSLMEVNWVYGVAAAGKETFIDRVASDRALAATFGWDAEKLFISDASLRHIGQYADDPITERREEILNEVPAHLGLGGIALIKWQFVDTASNRPERLADICNQATHRALVLVTPIDELVERIVKKPWWPNISTPAEEYVMSEVALIDSVVDALPATFDVIRIKGGANENYEIIT